MGDVVDLLRQLNFSEYEARVYLALLRENPQTGYELARSAGLPRANVYTVLDKLEKRGVILRLDTNGGVRYTPISPQELVRQAAERMSSTLESVETALGEVTQAATYDFIWNARGYEAFVEHARTMLNGAQKSVLIAIGPGEARELANELAAAKKRSVRITTLCLNDCAAECGNCRGTILRYHVAPLDGRRWFVLVADEEEMLAGQIETGGEAQTVRTRQPMFVRIAADYIRRSAALAVLVEDPNLQIKDRISPKGRDGLLALGDYRYPGDWLEQFVGLLANVEGGDALK